MAICKILKSRGIIFKKSTKISKTIVTSHESNGEKEILAEHSELRVYFKSYALNRMG